MSLIMCGQDARHGALKVMNKRSRTAGFDLHLGFATLAAVALFGASACTGTQGKPDELPTQDVASQKVDLDPMLIKAGKDGEPGQAIDASEVFERAFNAYSGRQYEEALKHYATIIKYFPESRYYLASLFNSGLACEKLEQWAEAATHYKRIIEQFPKKKDAKDAYFRLAEVYQELGEHQQIVDLITEAMLRPDLNHFDRVEAHVRRANAMLKSGQLVEAEQGFRAALRLNDDAPSSERLAESSHFMVQAQFGMGRALHLQVLQIKLVLPTEKMGEDLDKKAQLFLKSQSAYIEALRIHHPQWSVAAGFMIGRLYEDFYLDIFQAEIPDDLTEEQLTIYFEELRKQLRPLMVRATQVYKKNLSLSQRIVADVDQSEWVNQTDTHLKRLQAYLDDPFTQRRAERLVLQKRDLKDLWDPRLMAHDVVQEAKEKAIKQLKVEAAKNKS